MQFGYQSFVYGNLQCIGTKLDLRIPMAVEVVDRQLQLEAIITVE